jgi:hypothetical protein
MGDGVSPRSQHWFAKRCASSRSARLCLARSKEKQAGGLDENERDPQSCLWFLVKALPETLGSKRQRQAVGKSLDDHRVLVL